jgi:hypothetical protein
MKESFFATALRCGLQQLATKAAIKAGSAAGQAGFEVGVVQELAVRTAIRTAYPNEPRLTKAVNNAIGMFCAEASHRKKS